MPKKKEIVGPEANFTQSYEAHTDYPHPTDMASGMAGHCCVCGFRKTEYKFWVKKREDGSYHYKDETLTLTVIVDRFQISPFICAHCHSRHKWIMGLSVEVCDSCQGSAKLPYELSVRDDGWLAIEDEKCYIFRGQVTSGRVCDECYRRNASLARKEEELDELYRHFSKDLPSPIYPHAGATSHVSQPAPTSVASRIPIGDFGKLADILEESEMAKSKTSAMIKSVQYFLRWRDQAVSSLTMMNGNTMHDGTVFNATDFVDMQECFAQMLESQLEAIRADQAEMAAEMTRITDKQRALSEQRK
jgi:hypothetical protein